ncbi:SD repeat-containing protein [Rhodopirellula maiorica SM1]|uniref:SD repeat-containing protein n=1 Tax=Rhodopirellula maiorica SM1 TaxID=1265738 RepID=M5S367_9BACT|nr:hypothetical protein [Rhodopirellula maiorica]EMI20629.1 SD repeat-containing protein [Rhodopirellula maiorica SM1]
MKKIKSKMLIALAAITTTVGVQAANAESAVRLPANNSVNLQQGGEVRLQLEVPSGESWQSLAYATVTVVDRNGIARKFQADQQGIVRLTGISAEPYAVVASNGNAYGSTLMFVRPEDAASANPTPARMTLAQVNSSKLMPWIDRYTKQFSNKHASQLGEVAIDIPTETATSGSRIELAEGGVLSGQLVSVLTQEGREVSLEGTEVVLMHRGVAVGKTYAEASGAFQFKGVRSGPHGIVAAGPSGYATLAFEAVGQNDVASKREPGHQFVSVMNREISSLLPVVMVPPAMIPGVIDPFGASVMADPIPSVNGSELTGFGHHGGGGFHGGGVNGGGGGGFAGGGGGGVAGGSGGGAGLGGLGALGAIGAAIAIPLATDDDDPGSVASPSGF